MFNEKLQKTIQQLEVLKAKIKMIISKLKLSTSVLVTKDHPIPFGFAGLINIIQQCMSMAQNLSTEPLLQRFGIWTWCFEYFNVLTAQINIQDNLQSILCSLRDLIRGFQHVVDYLTYEILGLASRFKPST